MLCVEEDGLNGVLIKKSEYNLTKLNVVANLYVSGFNVTITLHIHLLC